MYHHCVYVQPLFARPQLSVIMVKNCGRVKMIRSKTITNEYRKALICPSLYRNDLGNLENVNKLSGNRGIKEQKVCMPFTLQGLPKNCTFSECCWSHSKLAQSPFAGTPCVRRLIFWSFLTKTKQDQEPPKSCQKFDDFVLLVHFFGHPVY